MWIRTRPLSFTPFLKVGCRRKELKSRSREAAAVLGAARELYEETGIDLRGSEHRLTPFPVASGYEYKGRRWVAYCRGGI